MKRQSRGFSFHIGLVCALKSWFGYVRNILLIHSNDIVMKLNYELTYVYNGLCQKVHNELPLDETATKGYISLYHSLL